MPPYRFSYTDKNQDNQFPVPDTKAAEHSQRLHFRICQEINSQGGSISFARFMELALYEPGLGYYTAGARKFGKEGDFTTAPEITSVYSRCIARQCEQILNELGSGSILELGPGTGIMACDILKELEQHDSLPDQYLMLDTSADLRARQQQSIRQYVPHLEERIRWLDTLPAMGINGVIIANEVLDAIPVNRIYVNEDSVDELSVGVDRDQFTWVHNMIEEELHTEVEEIFKFLGNRLQTGYVSEINIRIKPWLNSLAEILERGVMLFIDYGYPRREYYHPQRNDGTLVCHYRHRMHSNPFLYPGLQDITASVDFTQIAEIASDAGLHVSGYTTQAHFLMGCGLDKLLDGKDLMDSTENIELARQVKMLTVPGEMGERYKAIALTKNMNILLTGFQFIDHRTKL